MTAVEMNAPAPKKMDAPAVRRRGATPGPWMGVVLALAAGGCAATPMPAPLDADARALADAHRRYPRWADFPARSADVPAVAIAAEVRGLGLAAERLAADTARIDWTLSDPLGFAASARSRVTLSAASALGARTPAEVEAFAAGLRARAAAPPPIDRHR